MTWRLKWLNMLLLGVIATSACLFSTSPEDREIEAVITSYYDAVKRNDEAAQVGFWVPSRVDEAKKQAKAWEKRDREGLKPFSFHVDSTQEPKLKIVHYSLAAGDRRLPEGKAALVQNVDGTWRLRELQ